MFVWCYLSSVALSQHIQTANPINRTKNLCLRIYDSVSYSQWADSLKHDVSTAKSKPAKSLSGLQKKKDKAIYY